MTFTQQAMDLSAHPTTADSPLSGVLSHYSAPGGPLAWQADKGRTPAQVLADAIERFTAKYGIAPTYAEVHPTWAALTADGVTVFPNRAVDAGTVRVGVR